jgi:hypothetical protein
MKHPERVEDMRDARLKRNQEDAEDLRIASERLSGPQPGITSNELRRRLGLDKSTS